MTSVIAPRGRQKGMALILQLLQKNQGGMTSDALKARLNTVSKRSVDRYLKDLEMQALVRRLGKDNRARLWELVPVSEREQTQRALHGEIFAMIAAEAMVGWLPPSAALQIKDMAQNARKMLDRLADSQNEEREKRVHAEWPQRFRSFPGAFMLQEPEAGSSIMVDDIKDAVYGQRQMDVIYVSRSGGRSEIPHFHPLAYLQVGHTGYVVGYDGDMTSAPVKLYAVQRFQRADPRDSRFSVKVPDQFRLDTFLETSPNATFLGGLPRQVRLRVWDWLIPVLRESKLSSDMQMDLLNADSHSAGVIVMATVTISWQFEHWILSCGAAVEVLEPADLREQVENRIKAAGARYFS